MNARKVSRAAAAHELGIGLRMQVDHWLRLLSQSDDPILVAHAAERIEALCGAAKTAPAGGPAPELWALVRMVARCAEKPGHRGLALAQFAVQWPEHPLDAGLASAAFDAWNTRRKWAAIVALARNARMTPPTSATLKQQVSRAVSSVRSRRA